MNSKRASFAAQKQFKKNPHGFASRLFKDSKSASPTFSQDVAKEYFSKTYRDEGRGDHFEPLPEMRRPNLPESLFAMRCPTLRELCVNARSKSNRAVAGLNGLTYVPYKKCRAIMVTFHKIVRKIWQSRDVPEDWAQAFIVLMSKSDLLDLPSEFRPIAIASTVGKIFFSATKVSCFK